jgi:hypothetical protein
MPIPGVSVLVKGTIGTQTDFDGKYVINASPSQILQLYRDVKPRSKPHQHW